MLDHMSNGRFILGIGRGLGRVEFEGFGVNQEDSRATLRRGGADDPRGPRARLLRVRRQVREAAAPRASARDPFKSFRGRTYAAAVSPESSQIMAQLGIGILIIPQKPWDVVADGARTTTAASTAR